jgi:tetratricopeptide (TPR) repeat protein
MQHNRHSPLCVALLVALLTVWTTTTADARTPQGKRWGSVLQAASFAAKGRTSRAIVTLSKLRRARDTPALATASGLCRLMRGDLRGAQRDLDKALQLGGSYVDGHYWTAVVALRAGTTAQARKGLRRALTLGGDRPQYLMLQVLLAKQSGQQALARLTLAKLAKKQCELLDPALYPDPMVGLVEAVLHVLRRFPQQASVLFTAGNLMLMTRRFHQAKLYYLRAQKILKQSAGVLLRRARLAMVDANLPVALRLLDRGLALVPGAADLRSTRAEVLIALGRPTRARAELERAVKANPRNSLNLSRLADLLWDAGGFNRAHRLYRYAVRQNRGLASARYGVARSLDRLGRYKKAEQSYRAATALSPANERYHLALGLFYDKLGRKAEGAQVRARALRARALAQAMERLNRRAASIGTVARQACRVARAAAVPAARLIIKRMTGARAVRGFIAAHLSALTGKTHAAGLAAALAGLKPARLLTSQRDQRTTLTIKGKIDPQIPVVLKRYLSYVNPDLMK